MHHFLYVWMDGWMYVCDVTKIHIWGTAGHMALKFGQGMGINNLEVDVEGQGHRSKVKVTRSKNVISGLISPGMVWHIALKFGLGMDVNMDYLLVGPGGQGQRLRSLGQIHDFRPIESGYLALPWWWKLVASKSNIRLCNITVIMQHCMACALITDLGEKGPAITPGQ